MAGKKQSKGGQLRLSCPGGTRRIERAGDADPGSLFKGGEEKSLALTILSPLHSYLTASIQIPCLLPTIDILHVSGTEAVILDRNSGDYSPEPRI